MIVNRLTDYLDHMKQAADDACGFVEGMHKEEFLTDKKTQQAVVMSLIIIGEAATKVMEHYPEFVKRHPNVPWRNMRGMRNRIPDPSAYTRWLGCWKQRLALAPGFVILGYVKSRSCLHDPNFCASRLISRWKYSASLRLICHWTRLRLDFHQLADYHANHTLA